MRQVCTTKCYRTTWQPNHFFQFFQFWNDHNFHHRSLPRVRLAFLESSILHLSICDRRALPNLILLRDGQIIFSKLIFQFSNDHNFHHRSLQEVKLSFLECFIFHISIWDGTRWPCLASLNDGPKWSNFQSLPELAFSSEWSWEPQTWYETIFYLVSVRENYSEPKRIQEFGERLPKSLRFHVCVRSLSECN